MFALDLQRICIALRVKGEGESLLSSRFVVMVAGQTMIDGGNDKRNDETTPLAVWHKANVKCAHFILRG